MFETPRNYVLEACLIGLESSLSKQFKFSRRMIIHSFQFHIFVGKSAICVSEIFVTPIKTLTKTEPGHPSGAPSTASTYLSSVLGS